MTVIAYRDGVMAADSLAQDGVLKVSGLQKVIRGDDGSLYGMAGAAGMCCEIRRWIEGGLKGDRPPLRDGEHTADVLAVSPEGAVSVWTVYGTEDYPGAAYMAIGSGSAVAMGALFMGASADRAVEAAIEHGLGCGGQVMAVRR